MAPLHLLCLLLCMASSPRASANPDEREVVGVRAALKKPSLPLVLDRHTETLAAPAFRGHGGEEVGPPFGAGALCGIECQSTLPPLDRAEQERILGYETVHENGTRTGTRVSLRGFRRTPPRRATAAKRRKRQIFGTDGRFVISDSRFATSYPFSAAVRLSTGCSGVLVSARHVLTAAHCVHDGRDYLEGVPKLKVGVLQLKTKRGRGGGRGGGRRRRVGGRRGRGGRRRGHGQTETAEEKGEAVVSEEEEGEEHNSVDPAEPVRRRGGRGRRLRKRGRREGVKAPAADEGRAKAGVARRAPRSVDPPKRPAFRWSRVRQTHVPNGWILTDAVNDNNNNNNNNNNRSVSADYDYALLELKRPVKQKPMSLGVAATDKPLERIHFSGYDTGRAPSDRDESVVYRFCAVTQESDDLMYQHCDAQQGATGAGVYIRARQEAGAGGAGRKGKGRWQRKVIGVFSGHRWVEMEGGQQRDFNVAVRITPAKYAQICHWIHGDPSQCEEV
ncbi:unnamed protein product [Merluccius merluccius]